LRKFYFYHTTKEKFNNDSEATYVWLPFTPEAEQMISHIKKHFANGEYIIEKTLQELFNGQSNLSTPVVTKNKKNIFLYAQSDTLANSVYTLGKGLDSHHVHYIVPQKNNEKAEDFYDARNVQYKKYSFSLLKAKRPDLLILLNDWSKEGQRIIAHCHLLHIPVICLQESVIDFGDHFKRMQWADEVFVQGSQTILDLTRSSYYVTGNPRYEVFPQQRDKSQYVLINCNFTYGIFEDKREAWLDDIHQVLCEHDLEYAISQHPRDTGDLKKYKRVIPSSSGSIIEQLTPSKFLITRFSSLIHEALVMGIPVIYYNPHGEKMQYDFEFDEKILQLAKNRLELEQCVGNLKDFKMDRIYLNHYLARHCICQSSPPSKNIEFIISSFDFSAKKANLGDYIKMLLYHPAVKKVLSKIRKTVKRQ
jgi:hypothetical protein